jgi:hypothetical protein
MAHSSLREVRALLLEGKEAILLDDAEYDTMEMLLWQQENTNLRYVLRTSPKIYMQEGDISQPIRA